IKVWYQPINRHQRLQGSRETCTVIIRRIQPCDLLCLLVMNDKHDFIENNLIILSKQTLDLFLKQDNSADLIALYTFYYYTGKWQETNQPKATTSYVAKALHWDTHKVIRLKKKLIELGLIEDIRHLDKKTKKVKGWY